MPKGPQGQKRPADVVSSAVMIAKIATGEIEEQIESPAKEFARKGGLKGGKSRAKSLSAKRRKEIASEAAKARWSKK